MSAHAHLLHDARDFPTWRDETAAAWEQLATHADARALIADNPKAHRRRARTLRKFARQLREEME